MDQNSEHLRLLSIFHYVVGGLLALCACFPIFHLIIGLVLALRPELFGPSSNPPPRWMGWFFAGFAGVIIAFGWIFAGLIIWSGRCLNRRRNYTFCLVSAGIACAFMPFGTVLGIFTLIVLARPEVKALFDQPRPKF